MNRLKCFIIIPSLLITFCLGCQEAGLAPLCETPSFFSDYAERSFKMGFSTWSFGPDESDRRETYQFIAKHADVYSEQLDEYIPWRALEAQMPLPEALVADLDFRLAQRPLEHDLLLSVSLLNLDRSDLLADSDGYVPTHERLDDDLIVAAYEAYLRQLLDRFQPQYLVMAMEINDLYLHDRSKWEAYKNLAQKIRSNLKASYPAVLLSESVVLHNWYEAEVDEPDSYLEELANYVNQLDFAAISFYPFFKGQKKARQFQKSFDFLHEQVNIPIAFVETTHLAEDLSVPSYQIEIASDECEQNAYLETLLLNAQENEYLFIIWWSHRDYDLLWQIFPDEVKDIGKLWRDTGLIDENGDERIAYRTWELVRR
ncbi:MAG: glycosyl hydrolase 53 family protein [Bacteroidota bacterium]